MHRVRPGATFVPVERARVLEREGCPLHYWVFGKDAAPPLLLIHGAGIDHRLFRANIEALATHHRVIACDVRGHGLSRPMGAPFTIDRVLGDLFAILDAEGARDAIFIGQSMGGNLAQEAVRRAPERVRAMVLVDCACNSAPLSLAERFGVWAAPAMLALYPREALLRHSAHSISSRPDVRAYCLDAMRRLTKAETLDVMRATLGLVRAEPDYRIPKPFLLIRGAESRAGAIAKQGPLWAAREPECRGDVVIPGAGHCVNMEEPAAFDRAVRAFLDELAPAAQAG